jgi:membrane-bound lytic murein transglycosylase D
VHTSNHQRLAETILKLRYLYIYITAIGFLCGCSHFNFTNPASDPAEGNAQGLSDKAATSPAADLQDDTLVSGDSTDPATDDEPGDSLLPDADLPPEGETLKPTSADGEVIAKDSRQSEDLPGQSLLDEALDFCEVAQSSWQKGELENALEALDKAYSLILEVDTLENAKLIQQKEDLRFLISKRILEIYASRNIVVNGGFHEIPLAMNRHVEKELKRFTGIERQFFEESYQRSGVYRPYILEALKKEGMPEALSWLPLIESGFKVRALSRARALGLWQFIPSTGYKFGLKRNSYVDERLDFIKATDAAIAYLKQLHSIFGDWATVLAAYNCGEGRVLKVIRTQNINYLDNFWDLYQQLPLETARYVPRFFATLHIIRNPEKYGFHDLATDPPLEFETIEINRQAHLKGISKTTGIDLSELRVLNPELRYQILPAETYRLRIPKGSQETLMANLEAIPITRLPQRSYLWHRVRRGESLSTIARRYRTSITKIKRANNLRGSMIRSGRRLKIPQRGYVASSQRPVQWATAPTSGVHYVHKGDSLWIIAKRYGTTVKKIQALNGLNSNHLYIGQPLRIPGFKPEPLPDTSQLSTYAVQRGDSPFTIAQKHNMPLERLLQINKLTPRSKIFPGQKLYID